MGLSDHDIVVAMKVDVVWHVKGYEISLRGFPWNGWQPLLIATPAEISGDKIGYSNCNETLPPSWHYDPQGTATVFCPDLNSQKEILEAIKTS